MVKVRLELRLKIRLKARLKLGGETWSKNKGVRVK